MKKLGIFFLLSIILFSSCTDSDAKLEKMIPESATGIIRINAESILEKGELLNENKKVTLPDSISSILDKNNNSPLCKLITTMVQGGFDFESNIFIFTSNGFYKSAMISYVSDSDNTKQWIERKEGENFQEKDDIEYICSGPILYALKDNLLFIGKSVAAQDGAKSIKELKKIIDCKYKSITSNKNIKDILEEENDIVAYIQPKQFEYLLKSSETTGRLVDKFPFIRFITESDVKALVCKMNFEKSEISMSTDILVPENSQYCQLVNKITGNASAEFLKAMPVSLDNILTMSLKGESIIDMPEVKRILAMCNELPGIRQLDFAEMIRTIDGPISVGISKDITFNDEYNYVITVTSNNPDYIIGQLKKLGSLAGQAPEIYNNEYIYEYFNKRITIGLFDKIVYIKMLDYEIEEANMYANNTVNNTFSKSKLALYSHLKKMDGKPLGQMIIGSVTDTQLKGSFISDNPNANAVQSFISAFCSIKTSVYGDFQGSDGTGMTSEHLFDMPNN